MLISNLQLLEKDGECRIQSHWRCDALGDRDMLLWHQAPHGFERVLTAGAANAFVAGLLLPAMRLNETLEWHDPISPKLFGALSQIQKLYQEWDPSLAKVNLIGPVKHFEPEDRSKSSALFFSGGVDSFYSLLRHTTGHRGDLSHLVVVQGFDISLQAKGTAAFEKIVKRYSNVAERLQVRLLPVRSNVKEILDLFVPWGRLGHGAALASVGLVLARAFQHIYIASSQQTDQQIPWGSHPLLDPLWSTDTLTFVHDGWEANRLDKIRFLGRFPVALENLRVCYSLRGNGASGYNCGCCEKCLRTMIGLHLAGVLDGCRTLPHRIDPKIVEQMPAPHETVFIDELINALGSSETDQQIKAALQAVLSRSRPGALSAQEEPGYRWLHSIQVLAEEIASLARSGERVILVDEDQIRELLLASINVEPFLQQAGQYWGPPSDDASAIRELERLRETGTHFIAFVSSSFWWLDHYADFHRYLQTNFRRVANNERLVAFDLRKPLA